MQRKFLFGLAGAIALMMDVGVVLPSLAASVYDPVASMKNHNAIRWIPNGSVATHLRNLCIEDNSEVQYYVCQSAARAVQECRDGFAKKTTNTDEWTIACSNAAGVRSACEKSKNRSATGTWGQLIKSEDIRTRCGLADALDKKRNGPAKPIANGDALEHRLYAIHHAATVEYQLHQCSAEAGGKHPGTSMACSRKTTIEAVGTVRNDNRPSCPSSPDNAAIAADVLYDFAKGGGTPAALAYAILKPTMISMAKEKSNWHNNAGCRTLCAIVPAGKTIVDAAGYFSDSVPGEVREVGQNSWDHWPGHVSWTDPRTSNSDQGTAYCATFRNWLDRSLRWGQLVVYYR